MKKYVIIVAGGKGLRMGSRIPKQFLSIAGKPVLMHTIDAFLQYDRDISVILVLPSEYFHYWEDLCRLRHFLFPCQITAGGNERYYSVKNALEYVDDESLVAVHDGVRPFVSRNVITNAFETAQRYSTAIPVIPLTDSIRKIQDNNKSITLNRNDFRLVQTPQCFYAKLLKEAYKSDFSEDYTDDAGIVEKNTSTSITLIDGNIENIKLTTPFDFEAAEFYLKKSQNLF